MLMLGIKKHVFYAKFKNDNLIPHEYDYLF